MKINKNLKKIRKLVTEYRETINKLNDLEEAYKLQSKQRIITDTEKNYRLEELTKKKEDAQRVLDVKLKWLKEDYEKQLETWAKLDSRKIDYNDSQLLKSGMNLKKSDYLQLEDKHKGNYTMLRLIYDHLNEIKSNTDRSKSISDPEHLVFFKPRYTIDKSTKQTALDNTFKEVHEVTSGNNSYKQIIWDNDEYFNRAFDGISQTLELE